MPHAIIWAGVLAILALALITHWWRAPLTAPGTSRTAMSVPKRTVELMAERYHYPDPHMLPKNRVDHDVEIQVGGTWHAGNLEHWRQRHSDQAWEGYVRWGNEPGLNHIEWAPQDRLRKVEPPTSPWTR